MEPLKAEIQAMLRERHQMKTHEVAYSVGDLVVIVDVTTNARRVLGQATEILAENSKRVLKG